MQLHNIDKRRYKLVMCIMKNDLIAVLMQLEHSALIDNFISMGHSQRGGIMSLVCIS